MMRVLLLSLAVSVGLPSVAASEKIFDSGPDHRKLVFVVVGDGYTAGEQSRFKDDVTRLIVDGLIGHDLYRQYRGAFNVYRIDVASADSGISTTAQARNTAFGTIYNGTQKKCWISDGSETVRRIVAASKEITRVDYFVLVANTPNAGGCARGNRLYLTSASSWPTAAHEYGHAVGALFDEYSSGKGVFPFSVTLNARNCSTVLDAQQVVWSEQMSPVVSVPTTFIAGFDANRTVGMFEGCHEYEKAVYRPVHECRMKRVDRLFCPVCSRLMKVALAPHLASVPPDTDQTAGLGEGPKLDVLSMVAPRAAARDRFSTPALASRTAQVPAPGPAQREATYVNLVLQISQSGRIDILRATENSGPVPPKPLLASSVVYELVDAGLPVTVGALPEDLLTERSYGAAGEAPHRDAPADAPTVSVTIPNMTLERLANGRTSLQLYQVRMDRGARQIDMASLADLKRRNLVVTKGSISAARFSAQMLEQSRLRR